MHRFRRPRRPCAFAASSRVSGTGSALISTSCASSLCGYSRPCLVVAVHGRGRVAPHRVAPTTAPSPSPTTGRVLNNALSPGNAEAPECAREEDGAPDSMDVKDPHFQPKLQVSPTPTEQPKLDLRKS